MTVLDRLNALRTEATPGPWHWLSGNETDQWAAPDQVIRYRVLESAGRAVLQHAQTWQIRDAEADLIVAAVNALPALLRIARAARPMANLPHPLSADEREQWLTRQAELRSALSDLEANT